MHLRFPSFDALIEFTCASFVYNVEIDQQKSIVSAYFTEQEVELAIYGFDAIILEGSAAFQSVKQEHQ
jgi:hypothetical protein